MAAPNGDGMRGIGGGPSPLIHGPAVRQVVHHQQLPSGSPLPPQHPIPNHHIQQLQNLTQTSTVGAHHSSVHNAIHQQHRTQQQQPRPQLFHQHQQQHKISQFSGNINNLVFASAENASAEMNLARSGGNGREGGNVVVNIASVNPSVDASAVGSGPLLGSTSASSNSTSINPVVNRITTSVNHIPVENVQVLQQHQQQLTESASSKTSTMSPRAPNVAPGWRRIKYNCEIIYISPSGAPLRNFNQVKEYLLSGGTCKCGLPCPFRPEAFFEFDSQVPNTSLDSKIPQNFCLHHTGYMEKVEIVRRGKKVIESDGCSSKDLLPASVVGNFASQTATHDMRLPVPGNTRPVGNDGTSSSMVTSNAITAVSAPQNVLIQSDKEISSIPLSKTPPWRKSNPSSASTSIGKPNQTPLDPVVLSQRQMHSSSSVPCKTSVQSVNQNEQIVKNSRIITKSSSPAEWPTEEEASKLKSTTTKRPNFKDDPTGYLNQQTAILHSSISTLHSPDGSSSSQEGTHLKTVVGYDSAEPEAQADRGCDDSTSTTTTTLGGQTVTHIANGMVQVQQNCDISHMKLQQQMQFQQQLQRQSQLVRQHHEQLQLLQQQQQQQQQFGDGALKSSTVRFVTSAQESPVPCSSVTFTTSRTPDVTSTSPSTPDLKEPVQGGAVSTSNRSPMLQGNLIIARSESPETFSNRNFVQSTIGIPKNQSINNNQYNGNLSGPRNITATKPYPGVSSVENKITKSSTVKGSDVEPDVPVGSIIKTEKVLVQNTGSTNIVGFNQSHPQQGQIITQQQQQPQQVLMTSNGQIIVMSAQPNKNSNTIVMSSNPNNPGSTPIPPNVIIPQQSMMSVNTSQYMSVGSTGNTVSTVAANAGSNSGGIMQNITQHHPQQPNIIHHSQSNANSSFLISPQNNMQPTVILNSGNVIQPGGQQILTATNSPQMIHSGNVLTTATAPGTKMISGSANTGIITNQSNINQLLSLPPNSIVIQQPNYNSVPEGGHIVNQVINQDGTTTSYIQQQQPQQNSPRQILISTDPKRKAKKRKSNGSTNPILSPQPQPQAQQPSLTTLTQQTLQPIGQSGTMLQLTPPFPTQSFQLSPGISGLTIVPNKNPQPPQQQQQQQILLQNGQIITQPYNIISQQVLLPAGLVMAPDATTLVQIQNVAAPCGSMMIRAQSPHQQKGFLSPNSGQQFIMNSSGQISPMGAQMYGGPVNIVVPQQQAGASFVQQGTAILQQSPVQHMIHQTGSGSLNTSTDSSSTASESPSLPTTPQPAPIVQQKSYLSSGTASPPDTTTHSPNSPECASSEKSGGSADSMSMAMVQCVSSSEPDFVPPSTVDGTQSPSETTELFEQGGLSYQRIAYKSSEPKIRRIQTPTHQSHSFAVRSTTMHDSGHSGNTIISTSLPSPQISHQHQQLQNHILRHQHSQQQQMPHASSPSTSGGVQPDSHALANTIPSQNALLSPTVSNSKRSSESGASAMMTRSFNVGDLVWGAVRGFPAWPGKVIETPDDGRSIPVDCVWVRWFGGRPNAEMVSVNGLKTLSEGLEAHHRAQKDARKGRKLNSQLERAIQEAMMELDRSSETASPLPPQAASSSSPVIKTKTITIKASPTSSTTISLPPITSSQLITASNSNNTNKTVKPRGPKSKLVKIAPAPPAIVEPMLNSTSVSGSSLTLDSNRVKMK